MIEIKFPYWRDVEMNDIDKIHERLAKLEEAVFEPAVGLAVLPNGDTALNIYEAYDKGLYEGLRLAHQSAKETIANNLRGKAYD